MAPIRVDPSHVHSFADSEAFSAWLAANHDRQSEVWIRMHKVGSGLPSVTWAQAVDVALCWGWIDGVRKALDETSFLHRYTPRGPRSLWSRQNIDNVERLIAQGRMTPYGLAQVEAAKADGRWQRAYAGSRTMEMPQDLAEAIAASPAASAMLARLNAQNRYALAFRVHAMKTPAGQAKKIEALVAMLERGETPHPQKG